MNGVFNIPAKKERVIKQVQVILDIFLGGTGQRTRERPGFTIRFLLVKSNSNPIAQCGRANHQVWREEDYNGKCCRKNVGYKIICKRCLDGGYGDQQIWIDFLCSIYIRLYDCLQELDRDKYGYQICIQIIEAHKETLNGESPGEGWILIVRNHFMTPNGR